MHVGTRGRALSLAGRGGGVGTGGLHGRGVSGGCCVRAVHQVQCVVPSMVSSAATKGGRGERRRGEGTEALREDWTAGG